MEITDATIKGLSSAPSARADFTLNGSINRTAVLTATGQMNPMNALQYSKVDMLMTDFALTSVSPYAGKYIGYKIDKGALRTELKYNVKDDHVNGDNIITIDQLELGEKVASPDALNLPIKLGVTLLKDRNGRIALQVPVIGDVKDPRFDFAQAIKSALTGTIKKAGSEPFAAIREIDGFTGEALRVVYFDFGLSELQETETKKLNALASYLKEKDALILGIAGTADRQMDGAAVMEEAVEPDASDGNPGHPDDTAPEVAKDIRVDNNRLTALAQKRAEIVSIYLIEQAGIDAARIRIKPARIKPEPDGENGLVEFSLSVQSQ
jgi:outer membrane protein OmpA-like peptidoglycan-associated protein